MCHIDQWYCDAAVVSSCQPALLLVQPQRRQPARRRPDAGTARPQAGGPGAGATEDQNADQGPEKEQIALKSRQPDQEQEQRPLRRRLRPRPADTDVADAPAENTVLDGAVHATPATPSEEAQALDVEPQHRRRRPLQRRVRPRPVSAEEAEDVRNAMQRRVSAGAPRRRRPQAATTGPEESPGVRSSEDTLQAPRDQQRSRGHGRRLSPAPAIQNLPQVEVTRSHLV